MFDFLCGIILIRIINSKIYIKIISPVKTFIDGYRVSTGTTDELKLESEIFSYFVLDKLDQLQKFFFYRLPFLFGDIPKIMHTHCLLDLCYMQILSQAAQLDVTDFLIRNMILFFKLISK